MGYDCRGFYEFRARVRVHSSILITMEWSLRAHKGREHRYSRVATCEPSAGDWVDCRSVGSPFLEEFRDANWIDVVVETLGRYDVDYDVDDIFFTRVE